jgi:hypothetical protein
VDIAKLIKVSVSDHADFLHAFFARGLHVLHVAAKGTLQRPGLADTAHFKHLPEAICLPSKNTLFTIVDVLARNAMPPFALLAAPVQSSVQPIRVALSYPSSCGAASAIATAMLSAHAAHIRRTSSFCRSLNILSKIERFFLGG